MHAYTHNYGPDPHELLQKLSVPTLGNLGKIYTDFSKGGLICLCLKYMCVWNK